MLRTPFPSFPFLAPPDLTPTTERRPTPLRRARSSILPALARAALLAIVGAPASADTLTIVSADQVVRRVDLAQSTTTFSMINGLVPGARILGTERSRETVDCGGTLCLQPRMRLVTEGPGGSVDWYRFDLATTPPSATQVCLIQGGKWVPNDSITDYVRYGGTAPGDFLAYSTLIDESSNFYGGPSCNSSPGNPFHLTLGPNVNAEFAGAITLGDDIYVLRRFNGLMTLSRIDVVTVQPPGPPVPPYSVVQTWNVDEVVGNAGIVQVMGMTIDAQNRLWCYVNRPQSCQGHGWGDLVLARSDETLSSPNLTLRTVNVLQSWFNGGVGCLSFPRAWLYFDQAVAPTSITANPSTTLCGAGDVTLTANGGSGGVVQWFRGSCGGTSAGADGPTLLAHPTETTTYYARTYSEYSGASSCQQVTITVNVPNVAPDMASASPSSVCSGSQTSLSTIGGSGGTLRWYTDRDDPMSFVGSGSPLQVTLPETSTTVVVTYHARRESATCQPSDWKSVDVTVHPESAITLWPNDPTYCEGSNATLTAAAVGGPPLHVEWTDSHGVNRGAGLTCELSPVAASDAGDWIVWAASSCGYMVNHHFTVSVTPLSAPTGVSANHDPACEHMQVWLTAIGGSGEHLRWYEGSLDSPPLGLEGMQIPVEAQDHDTHYFARWETPGCGVSDAADVIVHVASPPANLDCTSAIVVPEPTEAAPVSIPFFTTCVPGGFSPDLVQKGVWFSFVATETGRGSASISNADFACRVAVWKNGCDVSLGATKLLDQPGGGRFPMSTGFTYYVHVGSTDLTTRSGTLVLQSAPASPCPPAYWPIHGTQAFDISAVQPGVPWSWRITGGEDATFGPLVDLGLPGLASSDVSAAATELAARINAVVAQRCSSPTIVAVANQVLVGSLILPAPGRVGIDFRKANYESVLRLSIGGGSELMCPVTIAGVDCTSQFVLPPVFAMTAEPYSNEDCNHNGQSDQLDVALGNEPDVNGDEIPDTCTGNIGIAFCTGDGYPVACPCGNESAIGARSGCTNSLGVGGALVASGFPNLSNDTLVLNGSGMPNSSALYFQGTLRTAAPFGDGLRCAGGAIQRLGTRSNGQGASSYPVAGQQPVSVRGLVTVPGSVRRYQVWYRNAASFCTASTFNLTNGLEIVWLF